MAAVKHFSKVVPGLGESTVRLIKKQSLAALAKNDSREEVNIKRPSTPGTLDEKVQNNR